MIVSFKNLYEGWTEGKVIGEAVKARTIMGPDTSSSQACNAVWYKMVTAFLMGEARQVVERGTLFDYQDPRYVSHK